MNPEHGPREQYEALSRLATESQRWLEALARAIKPTVEYSRKLERALRPMAVWTDKLAESFRALTEVQAKMVAATQTIQTFSDEQVRAVAEFARVSDWVKEGMLRLPTIMLRESALGTSLFGAETKRIGEAVQLMQPLSDAQVKALADLAAIGARIQEALRDFPPKLRHALGALGARGWYFHKGMSEPGLWALSEALHTGEIEEADAALADYYGEKADEVESQLVSDFPHRGHILGPAFEAHRRADYALAVPTFLAQADGICQELVGAKLYSWDHRCRAPATAKFASQFGEESLWAALLYPLSQRLPISASKGEAGHAPGVLNRHEVLHGLSLDYNTRANSLRSVSLLYYLATVVKPACERAVHDGETS